MRVPARRAPHPLAGAAARRAGGFTLVELMITLLVLAIVVGIGIPSFREATLGGKLGSHANNLVVSLHLARSEAIKRNAPVTVCPSSNGTSCVSSANWEQGWIVLAGTTVLQRQNPVTGGVIVRHKNSALSADVSTAIVMSSTGIRAGTDDAFLICQSTPSIGGQERVVTVTATGKPSVRRTDIGTCS